MKRRSLNKYMEEGDLFAVDLEWFWCSWTENGQGHFVYNRDHFSKKKPNDIKENKSTYFIYLGKMPGWAMARAFNVKTGKICEFDGPCVFLET